MAKKRPALGRGLGALIPTDFVSEARVSPHQVAGGIYEVRIDAVARNPYQPRRDFNEKALDGLTHSIEQLGIIQPITVRALGEGRFEVISGERRLRAARRAGLKKVPAYVRVANAEEMLEMALVENVQREQLNPIEVALGYRRLIEECGLRQEQVAQRVGKQRSTITNFLRLLRLPPRIQIALREGILSVGHARALLSLRDPDAQLRQFEEVQRKNLNVRQLEAQVRKKSKTQKKRVPALPTREELQIRELEQSLRMRFGTKVELSHDNSGKGTIELHFYSPDDLTRIVELLLERVP